VQKSAMNEHKWVAVVPCRYMRLQVLHRARRTQRKRGWLGN